MKSLVDISEERMIRYRHYIYYEGVYRFPKAKEDPYRLMTKDGTWADFVWSVQFKQEAESHDFPVIAVDAKTALNSIREGLPSGESGLEIKIVCLGTYDSFRRRMNEVISKYDSKNYIKKNYCVRCKMFNPVDNIEEVWISPTGNLDSTSTFVGYECIFCNKIRKEFEQVELIEYFKTYVEEGEGSDTHIVYRGNGLNKSTYDMTLNQVYKLGGQAPLFFRQKMKVIVDSDFEIVRFLK